jgi:tRNA-Thr(GGU) m(6)t(6)A37 methyltransferase TsaA
MRRWLILLGMLIFSLSGWGYAEKSETEQKEFRMKDVKPLTLSPIGTVKRQGDRMFLEILPQFAPALDGLTGFSHVWVLYWFHEHDRPEERDTLKVHPRRDPANPLTGVFATRAPVRPNLIGLTVCRLVKVTGNVLEVADLDAKEGSPLLDLKPYIPEGDSIPAAATPEWVKRLSHSKVE